MIEAELDAAGVTRPDLVIGAWAAPTILGHGTEAQRERFVPATLRGEINWCQLFSEPGAGSDLASCVRRPSAPREAGCCQDSKVWTSRAREADWGICLARSDASAEKHRGITYYLVDMASDGIDIRPLREITGDAMFTTLANERVAMSGGSSLGEGVERLLSLTEEAGTAADPAVLERLGTLVVVGLAVSLLDLRATLRRLEGRGPDAESSVHKLLGVWHRQAAAEAAVELGGPDNVADGGTGELIHEFLLTRCLSIAGGTTQIRLTPAAESILGLPLR